jgi:Tol biopolymer transport system component
MSSPRFEPSDDLIRAALTREPRPGMADEVLWHVSDAVAQVPQRPARWTPWPGLGAGTRVESRPGGRRIDSLVFIVVVGLLVVASVVALGLVGALRHRPIGEGLGRSGLIGFDSGGHIAVANPDGTGRRQLTFGTDTDIEPSFSPDGARIAYLSLDPVANAVQLVVMDADGRDRTTVATMPARVLASGPSVGYLRVSWSHDGQWLAYASIANGSAQVFVARADGTTGATPIGPLGLDGQDPTWSPDGTRIAFRGGHFNNERGIYVIGADGSGLRLLTPQTNETVIFSSQFSRPAWSPRGNLIAYSNLSTSRPSHIFVVGTDGGLPRDLSTTGDDDWAPAWSPDGTRIAWLRAPATTDPGQFVVARSDGSDAITLPPLVVGTPTWSPDGTRLIGLANDPATGSPDHLLVIEIASGTSVAVPAEPGGDPSWQRLAP